MSFMATTSMYIEMRNKRDLAEDKLHDMTKQRDTLIDDISVLKANISRLEREKEQLKKEEKVNRTKDSLLTEIEILKEKNEGLRFDIDSLDALSFEQSLDASRYWALTSHIRMKAENNPGVSRYIDLVNYIDRLERGDGEKI